MKKGGKIKVEVTHAPRLLLPTQVWASFLLATLVPRHVIKVAPFYSLLHSTIMPHATTI